ncbi:MAG: DUF370 domain-containing protein [Clostridia bacterium]|nr:DUF370 domain-containing protein [Clostridia bacterium]MBR4032531.1 DUF370 domain-containing protein [Clostridia bacterium]
MYLHVGNNKNIREKDIIGIFDMDMCTVSSITKKFLSDAQRNDLVVSAKDEIPKSFVLYKENGKYMICFSQISTSALLGRTESNL